MADFGCWILVVGKGKSYLQKNNPWPTTGCWQTGVREALADVLKKPKDLDYWIRLAIDQGTRYEIRSTTDSYFVPLRVVVELSHYTKF